MKEILMEQLNGLLEDNLPNDEYRLPQVCRALYMSRGQLFKKMKAFFNDNPSHYIRYYRLHRAMILLKTTDYKISEIAWRVGYHDAAYFSRAFRKEFGAQPRRVRAQA
jgi:AraC-like DNA-binding protein